MGAAAKHDGTSTNHALADLLARAGWSPEHLGDRLNKLAAEHGLGVRGHRRSPRRWLEGRPGRPMPVPREPWPSLVCHLLRERLGEPVTLEALGWGNAAPLRLVPADHGLHQPWNAPGTLDCLSAVVDPDLMERRQFLALTGLTLTGVAHQWLFDPARVAASVLGKRVDHAIVDDLQRVAEARRRMDDAIGGGTLLPAAREDLRLVVALLRNAAYSDDVGRRLYGVAAEFSRITGWLACDSEEPALAQRYFNAGLRAAHLSGDRAIGANVLNFMCIQAERAGNPRDAVLLAGSALRSEKDLTPAVAASLHARLGTNLAGAGEADGSRRSHQRSFDLIGRSVPAEEPEWIYWFDRAETEGTAGKSLLALGKFADAEPHLQRALALLNPTYSRDRVGWLCHLAKARLGAGRVDQACATAHEAATLLRRLDSVYAARRLTDFRRAAQPYARTTAVKDFDAKHRTLLRPRSA